MNMIVISALASFAGAVVGVIIATAIIRWDAVAARGDDDPSSAAGA